MRYFDRTNRMSNLLICSSIIFLVLAAGVFFKQGVVDQVFAYSNGNSIKAGIIFTIYFLLSVFSLVTGIALKCIVKDAKQELDIIKRNITGT